MARSSPPPSFPDDGDDQLPLAWGPFRLQRKLHVGWTHTLYAAEEIATGQSVALMRAAGQAPSGSVPTPADVRSRVDRLRAIRHDNLVSIHTSGDVDGRPYVQLEPVAGPRLGEELKRETRLAPPLVCAGMGGIAEAVGALHAHGIFLKVMEPSDIVHASDGRFVQHEFGLACPFQAAREDSEALGRPLWMSPEQMLGVRAEDGVPTDIYQLGVVLYRLLTGQWPFQTDSLHDLMRSTLSKRPASLRRFSKMIPRALDRVVLRCLKKIRSRSKD